MNTCRAPDVDGLSVCLPHRQLLQKQQKWSALWCREPLNVSGKPWRVTHKAASPSVASSEGYSGGSSWSLPLGPSTAVAVLSLQAWRKEASWAGCSWERPGEHTGREERGRTSGNRQQQLHEWYWEQGQPVNFTEGSRQIERVGRDLHLATNMIQIKFYVLHICWKFKYWTNIEMLCSQFILFIDRRFKDFKLHSLNVLTGGADPFSTYCMETVEGRAEGGLTPPPLSTSSMACFISILW